MIIKKSAKKAVRKTEKKPAKKAEAWKLAGVVTHYYDKIGVAVVRLKDDLKTGDKIKVSGGLDTDFEQAVGSMEFDHERLSLAKKGKEIGLKIKKKVREGYKLYKSR